MIADSDDEGVDFSNALLEPVEDVGDPFSFTETPSTSRRKPLTKNIDQNDFIDDLFPNKTQLKSKLNGSSFKNMGMLIIEDNLNLGFGATLLKAIARKGYKNPTPIQRKTIMPIIEGRDVVGMARTGSGKTACFVLPMIEKLKVHSAKVFILIVLAHVKGKVGARALIMSPSRELAIQTLKVVKEMSKGTDLRTVLLVGGDSLEEQFGTIMQNPDMYYPVDSPR